MSRQLWKEGDLIAAQWQGKGRFYKAKVLKVLPHYRYKICFCVDKVEAEILEKNTKAWERGSKRAGSDISSTVAKRQKTGKAPKPVSIILTVKFFDSS